MLSACVITRPTKFRLSSHSAFTSIYKSSSSATPSPPTLLDAIADRFMMDKPHILNHIKSKKIDRKGQKKHKKKKIERKAMECETFIIGCYYAHAVDDVYYRCELVLIDNSDEYSHKIKYVDELATAQRFRNGWIKPSELMPEHLMGSIELSQSELSRDDKKKKTKKITKKPEKKSSNVKTIKLDIQTFDDFRVWLAVHNMTKIPLQQTMIKMGVASAVKKLGGSCKLSKILNIPMIYTCTKKRKRKPSLDDRSTKKLKIIARREHYNKFEKEILINMNQIDDIDKRAMALGTMILKWNNNAL